MLVIRHEQMHVFEAAQQAAFVQRLYTRLEPQFSGDQPWLLRNIKAGVRCASRYGLNSDSEVSDFIEITCRHIPGGFREPGPNKPPLPVPALALLCTYGLDASVKIARYLRWAADWGREGAQL